MGLTKHERQLGLSALLCLVVGALFYALFRPAGSALWLPDSLSYLPTLNLPIPFYGQLPSCLHALSFTLLTTLCIGVSPHSVRLSAGFWLLVGFAFETLQHPAAMLRELVAESRPLVAYAAGTFDPLDLVATVCGVVLASLLVQKNQYKR